MADRPRPTELPSDQDESLIDLVTRYGREAFTPSTIARGLTSLATDPLDLVQFLAMHGVDPEMAITPPGQMETPKQVAARHELASSIPNAGELASKYLTQAGFKESETVPEQMGELGVSMLGPAVIAKAPKALSWGKRILGKIDEAGMAGLPRMAGGAERGSIDVGPKTLIGKSGLPIDEASRMKRAEEMGMTTPAYHGSPRNITSFSNKYSSPEGHNGPHHYFTSNVDDVNANYAGEGPDLTNRIQREIESDQDGYGLQQYIEDQGLDYSDVEDAGALDLYAKQMAKERLGIENLGTVYPVKLRMKNPVVVGGPKETFFDYNINVDDAGDVIDESGKAIDLINKTKEAFDEWQVDKYSAQDALEKISERILDGGITASEFDNAIRSSVNDLYDEYSGNMASPGALISDIFQKMGHDSIDMDASVFSNRRGFGGVKLPGMVGTENARHYIVFDPKNIRSRFAEFDPAASESSDLLKATGGAVRMGKGGLLKAGAEELAELAQKYLPKVGKSGLPIDEASRMKRAEEMGFDVSRVLYHSTPYKGKEKKGIEQAIEAFIPSKRGRIGPGVYFSPSPKYAGRYTDVGQEGSNVIPAYIRGKLAGVEEIDNAFDEARRILSDKAYETNKDYTTEEWKKLADKILKDRGFSGKEVQDEVVVFDPKNIRSRFAEFDPAASESAELSKATGGAVRKATGGLSRVNEAGNYTKPGMRKRLFNQIKARAVQGTKAGQWSARKAQLLAKKYKEQGGGYKD